MSRVPAALRVRTTDFRPPGAGTFPPLDRKSGPGAAAWSGPIGRTKQDIEHDKAVSGLSIDAALGAFEDMRRQKVLFPRTPDEWWVAKRYAALARLLMNLQAAQA